jgi:hypothetical protein
MEQGKHEINGNDAKRRKRTDDKQVQGRYSGRDPPFKGKLYARKWAEAGFPVVFPDCGRGRPERNSRSPTLSAQLSSASDIQHLGSLVASSIEHRKSLNAYSPRERPVPELCVRGAARDTGRPPYATRDGTGEADADVNVLSLLFKESMSFQSRRQYNGSEANLVTMRPLEVNHDAITLPVLSPFLSEPTETQDMDFKCLLRSIPQAATVFRGTSQKDVTEHCHDHMATLPAISHGPLSVSTALVNHARGFALDRDLHMRGHPGFLADEFCCQIYPRIGLDPNGTAATANDYSRLPGVDERSSLQQEDFAILLDPARPLSRTTMHVKSGYENPVASSEVRITRRAKTIGRSSPPTYSDSEWKFGASSSAGHCGSQYQQITGQHIDKSWQGPNYRESHMAAWPRNDERTSAPDVLHRIEDVHGPGDGTGLGFRVGDNRQGSNLQAGRTIGGYGTRNIPLPPIASSSGDQGNEEGELTRLRLYGGVNRERR